jgi:hypothetical protein
MKPSKSLLPILIASAFCAGIANAATIAWNFNNNDGVASTNELAGDGVVANTATFVASGGGVTASFGNQRAQRNLGTASSLGTATFTFTIDIGSTPISLTDLAFIAGVQSSAGTVTDNYYKWEIDISVSGASASETVFEYYAFGTRANVSTPESVTLSGLENLSNTSVTFDFTGYYGTNDEYSGGQNTSRWTFIDDVTFTAAVIPEPTTALLGGLGFLMLLRRRR